MMRQHSGNIERSERIVNQIARLKTKDVPSFMIVDAIIVGCWFGEQGSGQRDCILSALHQLDPDLNPNAPLAPQLEGN